MMNGQKILIVDDDTNLLQLLQMRLEASGYSVSPANDEDEARKIATQTTFAAAVIDLQLVNQDGISLMEEIHQEHPHLPVIILTAHGSIESAVDAMQRGAFTYLTKPFDARELLLQLERAVQQSQLTQELDRLRELIGEKYNFDNIIARSASMISILESIPKIAGIDSNVMIYGASGTGKELIAKAIHLTSPRKEKPFLALNCAAIPEALLESELFGHVKGAFTGAVQNTTGLFARADKGTLFLDEIGDMPLALQAKLLRVLQEKTITPLGGNAPIAFDVRIIAATNKNLKKEVEQKTFRNDLFYRIHVIPIELPLLKERKDDIPLLVEHFIKKFSRRMDKNVTKISPVALQKIMIHDWPGNVRELENTMEYAVAMASTDSLSDDLILPDSESVHKLKSLNEARDDFEKKYLSDLLKTTGGNVTKAAELAGRYRADLYNLMKKHTISPVDFKNTDEV